VTTVPAPSARPHLFSEVTSLHASAPGRFEAELNPEWTIGGKPNGGYLLALLGRAASSVSEHGHVIAASAHYLSSPEPGRSQIETHVLRTGRSASHVRARMSQGERACVEALIMTGVLDPGAKPYWDKGAPNRALSPSTSARDSSRSCRAATASRS
jgi:acyl-coenzyme A thioesterase PaaI-like protein